MTGGVLEVEIAGDRLLVKVRLWRAVGCKPWRDRDEFLAGYSRWITLLRVEQKGCTQHVVVSLSLLLFCNV